jgi:hypothetical protein
MHGSRIAASRRADSRRGSAAITISGYRIEVASTVLELDGHADDWDRLVEQSPARVHSVSHAWVTAFYRHFVGPGSRCRCVLAFDAGRAGERAEAVWSHFPSWSGSTRSNALRLCRRFRDVMKPRNARPIRDGAA